MTVITTPYYPRSNNDGIWAISASSNYNDNWAPYKIFNKSYNVTILLLKRGYLLWF